MHQFVTVDDPKRPKTKQPANKVMTSISWDTHRILFIDYLENGHTTNNDRYVVPLVNLKEKKRKDDPHMKKKKVLSPKQSTVSQIHNVHFKFLGYSPYLPDLASINFYLFADVKRKQSKLSVHNHSNRYIKFNATILIRKNKTRKPMTLILGASIKSPKAKYTRPRFKKIYHKL